MRVTPSAQWEPLCAFLQVPVPDTPFPHANNEAALNAFIGSKIKQGIARWSLVAVTLAVAVAAGLRTLRR